MLKLPLTEEEARDAVIVALDCDRDEAFRLADLLAGKARWVKVGMTLYYAYGPEMVRDMHDRGFKVFLDLKLHDIPFQIHGAARSASMVGADILSIHGLGGADMVAQARAGVEEAAAEREGDRTRLVAISVLTSMDQEALASIGVDAPVADEVARLAKLAVGAGSDGIVCSPQEAADMRAHRSFFADWTIRHPDEPNGELLQHCGPWPCSVARERPKICVPLAFVLSRFTAMPILPLYICVQAVELVKCLVGAALVRRRSWVNNLVRDI